ncbi:MAG: helix-turn-helix domain-containing protein [Streptosporangiaceae bacterium]
MTSPNPLSQQLRALRRDAGLSGAEAARQAGITQSKVSRAETGTFLPTEDDVRKLCRVYGAEPDAQRQMVEMTRDLREGSTPARVILQRGGWWMQQRIGKLEAAASQIRTFTPTVIIGLVQTRAYISALFGDSLPPDDLDKTVSARLERQRVLATGRQFTFLMAEGALRWNIGGAHVMAEQLDHLIEVSRLANVKIGVIPWTTPTTVPALHGFTIYDSRAVLLGTQTATAIMTDRRDISDYEAHWKELEPFASWGDDARSVIAETAGAYRSII